MRAAWAIAVALALPLGACGGGGGGETTVGADASPREIAELASFHGLHSGQASATLIVNKLKTKELMTLAVSGGFKQLGEGGRPQFDLATTSQGRWNGRTIDFNSRLLVASDGAIVSYGLPARAQGYEIDASTLEQLRSKFDQAQADGGEGDTAACLEAAQEVDFARLVPDPKIEGRREEPDGTRVVLISGEIDIPRLQTTLVRVEEDSSCGAQIEALGLPSAAQLKAAIVDFKKGFGPRLTLAVDRQGIIRSLTTRFECARMNGKLFELQLDFSLGEVNRAIEVSGSIKGAPLERLLRKFGTSEEAALRAGSYKLLIGLLEGLGNGMVGRLP
jgi:hypothetical protein